MIIILTFVLMIVVGLILMRFSRLDLLPLMLNVMGSCGVVICIVVIIVVNVFAMKEVHANELEYQSLCKRIEVIDSDNNKLSRSELIKDVNNYNIRVMETNYWTENPFTNWFNPRIIADNMRYISWWEGTEGLEKE